MSHLHSVPRLLLGVSLFATSALAACKKDEGSAPDQGFQPTAFPDSTAVSYPSPTDSAMGSPGVDSTMAASPPPTTVGPSVDSVAVPEETDSAAPDAGALVPIAGIALRPFAEGTNWVLTEPMIYRVRTSQDSVVVPKGFVTDFASVPPRLQSLISALGPYVLPAVMHDYLYWEQGCSRQQADRLFRTAMEEMGVSAADRAAMYLAVANGGQPAWEANARDRRNGLPRIIPDRGVRRPAVLESWRDYRQYLRSANVRPARPAAISPRFCAHGSR